MIQLLCGCQTPKRWLCRRIDRCDECGALHLGWHHHRRFCDACRKEKRGIQKDNTAQKRRRHQSVLSQVRRCIVCDNQIAAHHFVSANRYGKAEALTIRRRFCSADCSESYDKSRRRQRLERLKSNPELWAAYLEQQRTKGDPVKRKLRRERATEVRRQRRLVVRAVRELGLL